MTSIGEKTAAKAALRGIRVAEFGSGAALAYCGKLFADFGAAVVKVEPQGGDPDRRVAPLVDVGGGRRESAVFAWLNTNKQSVLAGPGDTARLVEIAAASDVLLDARPGAAEDSGPAGQAALRAAFPHLTIVSISWFGESGPYKDYAGADAVVRALAGVVRNVGPSDMPVMLSDHQAYAPAALSGFSAALAALIGGGAGRRFEISVHEASVLVGEFQVAVTAQTGFEERRWGRNHFFPVFPTGVYATKDGWLGVTAFTADQWRGFCQMMGLPELASRPGFVTAPERLLVGDELDAIVAGRLATRTTREWADEAIRNRVPLVAVPDMAELMASPIHRQHGAFGEVQIGAASFEAPVLPQQLTMTPPARLGVAPLAGEHTASWAPSPAAPRAAGAADGALPLAGVRIIDLTMGWAGPVGTRQLADLGAEVIKVEGRAYPDWWRGADYSDEAIAARGYEQPLYFNWVNRNKTGITLDLTSPEGVDLLLRLVRTADAVVENYGQGVLPGFGLDYEAFRAERPDVVMLSMPAFGSQTPWADVRAYGSTLEHAAGLPRLTGGPSDPPTMNHVAYGDPIGGLSACPALLTALLHRQRTGEGQYIDLSQVECLFPLAAPWMIEQAVTGRAPERRGNRHARFAPHGCFPCADDDAWVVIAVTDDTAWQALCGVIGRRDLADDPGLATAEGRRAREDELEAAISDWTHLRSPDEAMEALQAAGVAAGAARGLVETLLYEPHLMARGYWQEAPRPHTDWPQQPSPVFRENGQPYPIRMPAPLLGQSSREVLTRILGLGDAELDRLEAAGVIGEAPIPTSQRRPRSSALIHEAAAGSG
ncbi:MAG TPA: CoA transferase [Caulobacteraceae bacterium]|jgi:crotonobetainyl-CoA:carnitine CoA-transferase CaiB-like acyl-CoA transferase|nr:CoA transferase [Caulobacteraceae bacterium]